MFSHDEAINHPAAEAPLQENDIIKAMFENELNASKMVCIIEKLFEEGDWTVLEGKDPLGSRGCGFFKIKKGN